MSVTDSVTRRWGWTRHPGHAPPSPRHLFFTRLRSIPCLLLHEQGELKPSGRVHCWPDSQWAMVQPVSRGSGFCVIPRGSRCSQAIPWASLHASFHPTSASAQSSVLRKTCPMESNIPKSSPVRLTGDRRPPGSGGSYELENHIINLPSRSTGFRDGKTKVAFLLRELTFHRPWERGES